MSFSERMDDYVKAEVGDNFFSGDRLPVSPWAEQRRSRLGGKGAALEYRLVVEKQCKDLRDVLKDSSDKKLKYLERDVRYLLELLGEIDD